MTVIRSRWSAALVAAVSLAGMLAACTPTDSPDGDGTGPSDEPTVAGSSQDGPARVLPSVAVVLPARNARPLEEIERQRALVEEVGDVAEDREQVAEVRAVVPDRFSTMGDVVEVLAEEGHDLVCALGPGAARAVQQVAPRFPATRFCAAPGRLPNVPSNALVFDIRIEETAYLAGIAARFASEQVPAGRNGMPVLIVSDQAQGARLQPAFEAGYLDVGRDTQPTPVLVATDVAQGRAAAESQIDEGAFLAFASAGRAEQGVAAAAAESGLLVVGSAAYLGPLLGDDADGEPDGDGSSDDADDGAASDDPTDGDDATASPSPDEGAEWDLLRMGENLSAAVRDAIDELAAGWSGGSRSLGFTNGALTVTPGTSSVWERVSTQVLTTLEAIIQGDITVPQA